MSSTAATIAKANRSGGAQPTIGGSVYVKPQDIEWEPTQFPGISIKTLYEDKEKGELTCFLKWEPGATLPMHNHPEIEQSYVIEGSFYDHEGICRAGEFVWRRVGRFTRRIPTRARSSWRFIASRTSSSTAPAIPERAVEPPKSLAK